MNPSCVLQHTTLLFAVVVLHARTDPLYHSAFLCLTCCSLIRSKPPPPLALVVLDRTVAYLCYTLCAHTHLIEYPNVYGAVCLLIVLGLWTYECTTKKNDWRLAHILLHLISVTGALLAVQSRSSSFVY